MGVSRRNFLKIGVVLGAGTCAALVNLGDVGACAKTEGKESLTIPAHILGDLYQHAFTLTPHECCGILGGEDCFVSEHYRITNILSKMTNQELNRFEGAKLKDLQQLPPSERAEIAFQMDAREMAMAQRDLRSKGLALLAFYHSHTSSPARPSHTDINIAMEFERYRQKLNLPEPFHLVISLEDPTHPVIRAFRIRDHHAREVPIALA